MGKIRDNVRENLVCCLKNAGISQKELADRLNVSQSAVSNWVKGSNAPDIETIAQICEILDVPAEILLGTSRPAPSHGEVAFSQRGALPPDEQHLLGAYRALSPEMKDKALSIIDTLAEPAETQSKKEA